jgi:hypothetical protein
LKVLLDEAVTTVSTKSTTSNLADDWSPLRKLLPVTGIAQDALYTSQVPHFAKVSLPLQIPYEDVMMSGF